MNSNNLSKITASKIVFWDFDGVIKDSVEVKTRAFKELFKKFGADVVRKVGNHHTANGGMSRFEKIPIYLFWAGEDQSQRNVDLYCDKFAYIVEDEVVASDWVPGIQEILKNLSGIPNILVTATPQEEIQRILQRLTITNSFSLIFGAPTTKTEGIKTALEKYRIKPEDSIMIGDARADFQAATNCGTNFLLRRTPENLISMPDYDGPFVYNFL